MPCIRFLDRVPHGLFSAVMEPNIGIYEDEGAALAGLVLRLVEGLAPRSVFLFGSRARGDHRPDSDFDLLVVTKVEDGENGRDYGWVRRPLRGSGVGCDVVPVRCDDLEAELRSNASVTPAAMLDAIKLYDRDEGFLLDARRRRPCTLTVRVALVR